LRYAVAMAPRSPCALAISGLDPGGGAGLAADLRAFQAAGVFGCGVVAMTTVQSTDGIRSARALPAARVLEMAREVLAHQRVSVIKVGALGSVANVRAVADLLSEVATLPVVIDPVMIASRGEAQLVDPKALRYFREALIPRAALVTPNAPEAEALTRQRIRSVQDAQSAAEKLCLMGAAAALVKGGHLSGARAIDVLVTRNGAVHHFSAVRLPIRTRVHGGGCTLASLIAGRLACGDELHAAIGWSKIKMQSALKNLKNVGGHLRVIMF
jgi:hydroxymethylpyrimidine/phosphomethylpyrimidine kinase